MFTRQRLPVRGQTRRTALHATRLAANQRGHSMFWRKKRDGFEWHEYVRTTILLRRAHRRRKIDEVREAAIDGLKGAGRAASAGLGNAKAAAAAGLREAAGKGASTGASGSSAALASLAAAGRAAIGGVGTLASAVAALPRRLWQKVPTAASLASSVKGVQPAGQGTGLSQGLRKALTPLAARLAATRLGTSAAALPIGAAAVALAIGAANRVATHGLDTTTLAIAAAALACGALVVLPNLARDGDGPRDQAIRDRGGRPNRADYNTSDDISYARPLGGQAGGMLAWGVIAALAVLGLGPLLSPGTETSPAAGIVTSSISRAPPAGGLRGTATALDGATLRIGGRLVRLDGIEPPEPAQHCVRDSGTRWQCGLSARRALERLTRRELIACEVKEQRDDALPRARCQTASGTDIAAELVKGGHAFAEAGFFASYGAQEQEAREARKGIWAGAAQRPADYRTARWNDASKAAPEGCPIKGQISGRNRTYVLPWAEGYDRVKVRDGRGRWFCSEDEARAAGWQRSQRS